MSRPLRRIVSSATTAPPGNVSPVQCCRLSYLEAAISHKSPPVLHTTPSRGAKSSLKKAAWRNTLITTVSHRSLNGDCNPVVVQHDLSVRIVHPRLPPARVAVVRTLCRWSIDGGGG